MKLILIEVWSFRHFSTICRNTNNWSVHDLPVLKPGVGGESEFSSSLKYSIQRIILPSSAPMIILIFDLLGCSLRFAVSSFAFFNTSRWFPAFVSLLSLLFYFRTMCPPPLWLIAWPSYLVLCTSIWISYAAFLLLADFRSPMRPFVSYSHGFFTFFLRYTAASVVSLTAFLNSHYSLSTSSSSR